MNSVAVTIEIVGLARLRRHLQPGPYQKLEKEVISGAGKHAVAELHSEHRDIGAFGRSSVFEEGMGIGARVVVRHPGALPIEFGRHSQRMPPTEGLKDWSERHGLAGLEFVIARAIARRGVRGRFFVRKAKSNLHREVLPRLLAEMAVKLGIHWKGA